MKIKIGSLTLGEKPLITAPLTDSDVHTLDSIYGADMIELRVDMFSHISLSYLEPVFKEAARKFNVPLIATVRANNEGGAKELDDKQRTEMYGAIIKLTDAVDVEINSKIAATVVSIAKKHKKKVMGSFHNFHETPPMRDLVQLIKKGRNLGVDFFKIAVMPQNLEDIRTITEFTLGHQDYGIVTIAMGELGMAARIYLPLIGSLFTFASIKTQTAPGQISINEIKRYLEPFC